MMDLQEIQERGNRIAILATLAETMPVAQADQFFKMMVHAGIISETAQRLLAEHLHGEDA